jgi:tetratricopeptide (TPR) repeat protein
MSCRALSLAVVVALALPTVVASEVRAEPPTAAAVADAAKHFQRGVTMYNEADYRAALVEFRRAYEIAPNPAVLYNIGQTYYQLQNYAAALVALGRYLTEAGSGAAHRREVEQTIDTLQTRVGKVAISTTAPGIDITVDDELIGKSPLDEPVLVSIGRRKITGLHDGKVTETRFVDVAAGDTVSVSLSAEPTRGSQPVAAKDTGPSRTMVIGGWVTTGVFAVAAVYFEYTAWSASRDLDDARKRFPVTQSQLEDLGHKVRNNALIGDIALVGTVVAAAISVKWTLSQSSKSEAHVAVVPGGVQVAGKF